MKKKRNVKRTVLIVLAVLAALVVLLLAGAAVYLDQLIKGLITKPPMESQPQESFSYPTRFPTVSRPESTGGPTQSTGPAPSDPTDATDPTPTPPDEFTMPFVGPVEPIVTGENVINVMLLGQDASNGYTRTRTDTMILCSINTETHTVSMTSFMRDLYVYIPGWDGYHKLNSAYPFGGYEMFKATILYNYGVYIDCILHVKFEDFAQVVDILGGVDIDLTGAEADYLNNTYSGGAWNLTVGRNHLDGTQALGYSRIRAIDSDYNRTERQRKLLGSIFEAYKNKNVLELLLVTQKIMPYIWTYDLTEADVYDYIRQLAPMLSGSSIQSYRVPFDGTIHPTHYVDDMWVILADYHANRERLAAIIGG